MSSARCIAAMTTALGREPTAAELESVVEKIERKMAQKRRARNGKTDAQLYREAANELAPEIRAAAFQAKRMRLLNIKAREGMRAREAAAEAAGVEPATAVESLLVSVNTPFDGNRQSVEAGHKALMREYTVGGLLSDLIEEGRDIEKLARSRDMELPIMQELRELSNRAVGEAHNVGISGSPEALRIAQTIRKWQTVARRRENEAGSYRKEIWGYTTAHSWDSRNTWKIGKDEFVNDMLGWLDDRTFERQQSRIDDAQAKVMGAGEAWDLAYQQFRRANAELAKVSGKLRRAYSIVDLAPEKLDALDKAAKKVSDAFRGGMDNMPTLVAAIGEVGKVRSQIIGRRKGAEGKLTRLEPEAQNLVDMVDRIFDIMRAQEQKIGAAADVIENFKGRIEDRRAFMEASFDDIVTDRWNVSEGARADFDGNLPFVGPGNLAERVSRHRIFHFKSAEAEAAAIAKYGHGTLMQRVISEMDHTARNTAMMQVLGTNPEAALFGPQGFVSELLDKYHGQPEITGKLMAPYFEHIYSQVSGQANTLAKGNRSWFAGLMQGWRAFNVISLLGNMIMAQFPDIALRARAIQYQGKTGLSAYANGFTTLFEGLSDAERKRIGRHMGAGYDAMLGYLYSRFADQDALPGKMSKAQGWFMKIFGANYWTDTQKRGVAYSLASQYAEASSKAFGELDFREQRMLTAYGINDRAWDVIRQAVHDTDPRGNTFLTPDGIERLDLEHFMGYARSGDWRTLARTQSDLIQRYRMMLVDQADAAVIGPGARTRALMYRDTKRGEFWGEMLRAVGQFKSFPVAGLTDVLGRDWHGHKGEAGYSRYAGVAATVIGATILGYASLVASDMQKGWWPPRDPADYRTWIASIQRGGGLGLYGDVLFGEYHEQSRSLSNTLAGPLIGGYGDPMTRMFAKALRGDFDAAGAEAFRFATGHLPGLNMHLVKPTLDALILRDLAETVNPGAQRRMEQKREKDWGQRRLEW